MLGTFGTRFWAMEKLFDEIQKRTDIGEKIKQPIVKVEGALNQMKPSLLLELKSHIDSLTFQPVLVTKLNMLPTNDVSLNR
jgi:hypothetical protein